jgi:hypothetical protein
MQIPPVGQEAYVNTLISVTHFEAITSKLDPDKHSNDAQKIRKFSNQTDGSGTHKDGHNRTQGQGPFKELQSVIRRPDATTLPKD